MAVSLLWLMDIGNNTTMEPYCAYVSDRLDESQYRAGFLSQSSFTGLAQMLAFVTPSLLVYLGMNQHRVDAHNIPYTARFTFMAGAALVLLSVLYSVLRVPELPLTADEQARIARQPKGAAATFAEIASAIRDMPVALRKLGLMSLFQWYGMAGYWGYIVYSIGRSVYGTADPTSDGFRSAVLTNGVMGAWYNGIAFVAAFAMVPVAQRIGAGPLHAICLALGGIGMLVLPTVGAKAGLFVPAIGIAWGSIMGNPYVILTGSIPPERTGIYMGIFNMMIVIPMILIALTLPLIYGGDNASFFGIFPIPPVFDLLHGDPRNVIRLCGGLLIAAAVSVLWVREGGVGYVHARAAIAQ